MRVKGRGQAKRGGREVQPSRRPFEKGVIGVAYCGSGRVQWEEGGKVLIPEQRKIIRWVEKRDNPLPGVGGKW